MKRLPYLGPILSFSALLTLSSSSSWGVWSSVCANNSALMLGTSGSDSITISVAGGFLAHNRFDAGDPGFASGIDFDNSQPGNQTVADNSIGFLSIDGLDGFDSMSFFDFTVVNPNNEYHITSNSVLPGGNGTNRPTIIYTHMESLSLTPQAANAGVKVYGTSANTAWTINGFGGTDVAVGNPSNSLDDILGHLLIRETRFLEIYDTGDPGPNTYTIFEQGGTTRIERSGSGQIEIESPDSVRLWTTNADDSIRVKGNNILDLIVDGGDGTDRFLFATDQNEIPFMERLFLNRDGPGGDDVVFDDSGATENHSYSFGGDLTRDFNQIAILGGVTTATLKTGKLNDTVNLNFGGVSHMVVDAGSGGKGDVLVANGNTFFAVPEEFKISGDTSTISYNDFYEATFAGFDFVHLNAGDDGDTVTVSPSAAYPIYVDGEGPSNAPGDQLNLVSNGLPFSLTADTFSVQGKKPITFNGFESVSSPVPPAPTADLVGSFQSTAVSCQTYNNKLYCKVTATLQETNAGNKSTGSSYTRFFLSSDATLDANDPSINVSAVGTFSVGQTRSISFSAQVAPGLDPHGIYLIGQLDTFNQIGESNESNNIVVTGPLN